MFPRVTLITAIAFISLRHVIRGHLQQTAKDEANSSFFSETLVGDHLLGLADCSGQIPACLGRNLLQKGLIILQACARFKQPFRAFSQEMRSHLLKRNWSS